MCFDGFRRSDRAKYTAWTPCQVASSSKPNTSLRGRISQMPSPGRCLAPSLVPAWEGHYRHPTERYAQLHIHSSRVFAFSSPACYYEYILFLCHCLLPTYTKVLHNRNSIASFLIESLLLHH